MNSVMAGSAVWLALVSLSHARFIRVTVEARETPPYAANYERITGRFLGELDPSDSHNVIINDIRLRAAERRGQSGIPGHLHAASAH